MLLTHKTNRDRKPLLKTAKTGYYGLANRRVRFCRDRRQSGVPPGFDEVLLLLPSDIWTVKRREPQQPKGLKRRILNLIDEKKKN
jgi:hypothetical protein